MLEKILSKDNLNEAFKRVKARKGSHGTELYKKQRGKITTDIKKFIDNRNDLINILGDSKIKSWVLVVPRHESALLLKHANKPVRP